MPLVALVLVLATDGAVAVGFGLPAACGAMTGAFVERWPCFAQAIPAVTLYYGARTA